MECCRDLNIFIYSTEGSAPCRAVQMTAAAVGAKLNLKLLDLLAGEHMKPEFLKVITGAIACNLGADVTTNIEALNR